MKGDEVIFYVFVGFVLGASAIGFLHSKVNIMLSVHDWKCTNAITIDDDPSKTECVNYVRKNKTT